MDDNNQNSNGADFIASTAFSILKKPMIPIFLIICAPFIVVILIIVIFGGRTSAMEAIASYGGAGCGGGDEKSWASFITDEKEATTFYKKLNDLVIEKGVNMNMATAILTYGSPPSLNDRYACNSEEKNDEGEVVVKECEHPEEYSSQVSTKLYDESKRIVNGIAGKSDDEIFKWIKDNFIEDRLKEIENNIPKDTDEKEEYLNRKVQEIFDMKTQYESMCLTNQCTMTSTPNSNTRKLVRTTVYGSATHGYSLMGSLNAKEYIKTGEIYLNNEGYYMWKGGSTYNGKTYGTVGQDYLIVAAAAPGVENQYSETCGGYFTKYDDVKWFDMGETFTLELNTDGGSTVKSYNAIVLDVCGACIMWSPTHQNKCNPDLAYTKKTNGIRLDIYVDDKASNYKRPADTAYYTEGTSSGMCIGTIDLGDLVHGTTGTSLLDKSLLQEIGQQGINEINQQLHENVNKYPAGSGNRVAAAAITLINGLRNKGLRLPYFWGGGHGTIADGVPMNLGNPTKVTASGHSTSGTFQPYSFDCSGFVSWALYNGGCKDFQALGSASFEALGPAINDIRNAKPGDILTKSGHVLMVVQNNGGKVTIAESSVDGVTFGDGNNYYDLDTYTIVDMTNYYATKCK